MAGNIVLSDILQGGKKIEKIAKPKGKTATEHGETSAPDFAEELSCFTRLKANPKGQHSKARRNLEDGQDVKQADPLNISFPFFLQAMSQSDLPAGKEANSGNVMDQENSNHSTAISLSNLSQTAVGDNFGLDLLNLLSQASNEFTAQSGMMKQKLQGFPPEPTELDKYKQIIVNLLEELSREISDISSQNPTLNTNNTVLNNLSQEIAKVLQGWIINTDAEVSKNNLGSNTRNGIQSILDDVNTGINTGTSAVDEKLATLLTTLKSKLSDGNVERKSPNLQEMNIETVQSHINKPKENDFSQEKNVLNQDKIAVNDSEHNRIPTQTSIVKESLENNNSKRLQESVKGDLQKAGSKLSIEFLGNKDVQVHNFSPALGIMSDVSTIIADEGKTPLAPIWDQISTVLREQTMNRSEDLKHLDIQLHPEDLGKIQIDLHWENGQVHLQVQASETTTSQLLQNHLSDLRQAISNQGINCGMLQMGQGGERQQNSRQDDSRRPSNQNQNLSEDEESIFGVTPINREAVGENELNRLNVTA